MEWTNNNKYNQSRTSSAFIKKRWQERRAEMLLICQQGGQVKGKQRPPHNKDTKQQISETLKRKGCHPPWELSPCVNKGWKAIDVFGEEIAEKRRQATITANQNKIVSKESRIKMSEAKKGGKNPGWKGGVKNRLEQLRNGLLNKAWRWAIFKRDNFTCQQCGAINVMLNAHHIKDFIQYPKLRFAIENGTTLCLPCHKGTDNYGGKWKR